MTLRILHAPDPRLRARAAPVGTVDEPARALMDSLVETMRAAGGIGLAAVQVGVARRILVAETAPGSPEPRPAPLVMADPEIVDRSEETATRVEACLSVPGQSAEVTRPARVRVRFLDRDGARRDLAADGLLAACLQHEIDHLDGRLYLDRLGPARRDLMLRRARKLARAAGGRER